MKKITTIFIFLITALAFSQNNPINFEPGGNGDSWTWTVFENATNPPLAVVANPDPSGINTSATVAQFTALQAGMPFAGVESQHGSDIGTFTLDATNATVKIMVWKPVISNVGIKFATLAGASTGEILVPNTVVNQWEELTFDFSGVIGDPANTDIDQIVIFPDFFARTSDNVIFFDNITFGPALPPTTVLPLDFEGAAPTFNDFNGSFTQVIANPDATGVNTSANVAENTVPANAAFAGVNIPVPVDITTNKFFRMDVWSPLAGTPVLLKLEGGPNSPVEREAIMTTTGGWEEIEFDFSSEGALTYTSVTVFMNFNMTDPNTQTYFWDNLENFAPAAGLPFTFEGAPLPVFNDFNGSFTQVIANPDATGVNTSANVAENTVPANAAFAGVNIPVAIDITTDKFFRMDVWSPLAGTPVLLKLEGGPNSPIEREAIMTTTGAWEEVIFDFSSEGALTYESVTIFMNFNMTNPNNQTFFWDNLENFTGGPPPVALPLTFEGAPPTFNDFNGSFTQVIANPDATGVNTSANVAENTVPANAAFAGVNIVVPVDITTDKFFKMDVWSPLAGTPVLLKLEGGPNSPIEREVIMTTTGAWEEIVFDFSSEGALTYDSVTVFMNFNMVDPNTQTYFWDNLELFTPPITLPITFEGQAPVFNDFNGSFTQIIANPDPSGVNTSDNVAENTVPANASFAGVNIPVAVDISTDKMFTMDVWSPLTNTPVLLKLENSVTGVNVERQADMTASNAWEKLTFDFSSEGALTFDSVTIFMNFNMVDPNGQVYFWDNLEQVLPPSCVAVQYDATGLPADIDPGDTSTADCAGDPNLYPVTVEDPGTIGVDSNIENVTITITHTFDGDLDISLVSPAGTELLLSGGNGGGGDNFIDTVFMDGGADITAGSAPFTGTFEAQGGTFAAAFDGENIMGDWNLKVCDNFGGDTGTVDAFSINICRPDPPTNDECVNAFPVACGDVVVGETISFMDTGGNPAPDVWYSFTGTGTAQIVTLSLCDGGTDYDSLLRVFDACGGNEIAVNDDSCGLQSELSFLSDGTSTYYIMVEGFGSSSGNFSLAVTCVDPPVNDECTGAISMSCGETVIGETNTATFDAAAPVCVTGITAPGVWYEFTDTTGLVTNYTLSMCDGGTDYDSKITVYTGDCGALVCEIDNDDTCGLQSEVTFQGDGLTTYYILVHGFGAATGNFSLALSCDPVPPPNDMIVNSIDVDEIGFPYTDPAVAMPAATTEDGNPADCNIDGANGVWYNFVPTGDGFATAEIITPGGASAVTFYTAPDENATETDLTLVPWAGNQCVPGTQAIIPTVAGQAYYVFVLNSGAITDIVIDGENLGINGNTIEGFTYYPNPTDGVLNLSAIDNIENVAIYNILGQRVLDQNIDATTAQLDVSNLAQGAYLMKVAVDGQIGTYKIIKK